MQQSKQAYADYLNCDSEHDADYHQGEYAITLRLLNFLDELEQEYKDDFKWYSNSNLFDFTCVANI